MGCLFALRQDPLFHFGISWVVSTWMAKFPNFLEDIRSWNILGEQGKQHVSGDQQRTCWKESSSSQIAWRFHRIYQSCQGSNCHNSAKCCKSTKCGKLRSRWRCGCIELAEFAKNLQNCQIFRALRIYIHMWRVRINFNFAIETKRFVIFWKGLIYLHYGINS